MLCFVKQPPDWFDIGFVRRQKCNPVQALWHVGVIYNNLAGLNDFDQQVPLV
jgi:hypothetical protein